MKNNERTRTNKSLELLFVQALEQGIFSGAAAGIFHGGCRVVKTFGTTRQDARGIGIEADTFFDLASLTKPLCTLQVMLSLIEEKKINWSGRLVDHITYKAPREYGAIRMEHLLSHSAGLQAYKPFYRNFKPVIETTTSERLIKAVLAEKLMYEPGTQCIYSDLGYILLGEVIETVSGQSLDGIFRENIAGPLQMQEKIQFRPVLRQEADRNRKENIAATERCPWRGRILQGEVHDEHCWLLNGVAGHAGLFGTVEGVLDLAVHFLRQLQDKVTHPGYNRGMLRKCMKRQFPDRTWCLGFDTPSSAGSSSGKYMSADSVGHLGFTGTSFWIDPQRELVVVLLTNRVHPNRENEAIKLFRPLFHDLVIRRYAKGQ